MADPVGEFARRSGIDESAAHAAVDAVAEAVSARIDVWDSEPDAAELVALVEAAWLPLRDAAVEWARQNEIGRVEWPPELLAYDGSSLAQRGPLPPLARDILCRLVRDYRALCNRPQDSPIHVDPRELPVLDEAVALLTPRSG